MAIAMTGMSAAAIADRPGLANQTRIASGSLLDSGSSGKPMFRRLE